MSDQWLQLMGVVITFLLSVCAWYFKDIVRTLTEIRITLATLLAEHSANTMLIEKHDKEIDKITARVTTLESSYKIDNHEGH